VEGGFGNRGPSVEGGEREKKRAAAGEVRRSHLRYGTGMWRKLSRIPEGM